MSEKVCRWGIMSTAVIAVKNWQGILLAENATVTAVASRSEEKASRFIDECQSFAPFSERPKAYGDYESLLADDNVDAVYVPLPTGVRKEWVIRAAQAGKHVVCEKPCAVTAADLQEMTDACRENNVQFMDGVMYMHSQRLPKLREAIDDGESIGELKRIATQFSFRAPDEFFTENIRSSGSMEPAGCLGDLGWYTIRFSLFVKKYEMPNRVRATMLSSHDGSGVVRGGGDNSDSVPMEFSAELFWDDGVSASFYNSFLTENQEWANVSGSKGNITVKDYVLPFFSSKNSFEVMNPVFEVRGCDFNMKGNSRVVEIDEYSNSAPNSQETNLFRNFSAQVLSGSLNPEWPEIALKTQRVLDACLESARNGSETVEL